MFIISHKSSDEFKVFLSLNNFSFVESIDNPNLDSRIADHPDLSIFKLNDNSLVIDKNVADYYREKLPDMNIISGDSVGRVYPSDAIYNIYSYGNYYIHNDFTESHIESFFKENDYNFFKINQGYTRCSIIPMGNNILTNDYGIYKSLSGKINVILLKEDNIPLDGFPKGFLGGSCGYFENTLIFNGNIEKLNNYALIKSCAEEFSIKLLYPSCDLVDTGSILFF